MARITVESVDVIFTDENHNAFTDVCRFKGAYYLTFRSNPQGHMIFPASKIVVLSSADTVTWDRCFEFTTPGRDLRDPHLLVFGDALFVYSGTWPVKPGDSNFQDIGNHLGYCGWTKDGRHWNGPVALEHTRGYYIWRAGSHEDTAFINGRRAKPGTNTTGRSSKDFEIEGCLLSSKDGFEWRLASLFPPRITNETALLVGDDGEILALARGSQEENARLISAKPPYAEWTDRELDRQIGGPFLAKWNDTYVAGGREGKRSETRLTTLYTLDGSRLEKIDTLPSGGDNSYPGFVAVDEGHAIVSYYSSHEGSGTNRAPSSIYLARLAC